MGENGRNVLSDMSSSATRFPLSAVFGSGGGCGPVLAQCFWPKLGAEVACVSGLVVPVPLFGVEFVWLSGVWLICFGKVFELLDNSGTESRVGS